MSSQSRTSPRHIEIEADLRQKVASSEWSIGQILPGRRDLARVYGVSSLTIERAIDGLVREGLLRADGRRGTFVAGKVIPTYRTAGRPKHGVIGVIGMQYPEQHGPEYGHNLWVRTILQAIEHEFAAEGEVTVFVNTFGDNGVTRSLAEAAASIVAEGVDGVVLVAQSRSTEESVEAHAFLDQAGVPSVFIAPTELPPPIAHVIPDSGDAGLNATLHLIKAGCSAIGYLSPFNAAWAERRRRGVESACAGQDLSPKFLRFFPETSSILWSAYSETRRNGYELGRIALTELPSRSGLVCANDDIAFGVLTAAKELGMFPGKDFLIVGFDDLPEARIHGLTSLRVTWDALGREAARMLRATIDHDESLQVRLRWRLIPRASSRWHNSLQGV